MVPIWVVDLDELEELGFTIRGTPLLVKYLIGCRMLRYRPGMLIMMLMIGAVGTLPGVRAFPRAPGDCGIAATSVVTWTMDAVSSLVVGLTT